MPVTALGFNPAELWLAESVTNQVWMASDYVLKISSGRFRAALWHERRVLELARRAGATEHGPFPVVRRYGKHGRSEWLMMDRAGGRCLREAWPALSTARRFDVMSQVGNVLRKLHALPSAAIEPPWLRDAIDRHDARNIYHCPFEEHDALLKNVPADSTAARYLPQIGSLLQMCHPAFAAARGKVLTHGDVHLSNLMFADGKITALLDFEGAQAAPADQELDTLLRQVWHPDRFGVRSRHHSEGDRNAMISALLDAYPALFVDEETNIRLVAYGTMMWLNEVHHYPEARSSTVIDVPQISRRGNGRYHTYLLPLDITKGTLLGGG